ncbi:MAG: uroporphyrinogen decarboxylase family protein [Candidatus Merdivicinus sp.]|jgi:hypothetical protein
MPYYRENLEEIVENYRLLHDRDSKGALIQILDIAEVQDRVAVPEVKPLNQWNFDTQLKEFLDACLLQQETIWSNRMDVADDLIPSMYPRFGIAEHSAYLGGEVQVEKTTSYHIPIVRSWKDVDRLHTDPHNKWFRYVMDGIAYIQEKGQGKIAARLRGGCSPTDLANFVRGNDLFTDFYDEPEEVHRLLEKCTEMEGWFMKQQVDLYNGFCGGIIDGNGVWAPEGSFGHLSEDWSYMCSPSMYEIFGKPYTKKLIEPYQNALMHLHGGGAHVIPGVASIDKITYIQIVQDPSQPAPVDIYKKYEKELADKVIILAATGQEIEDNLDFLEGKRVIFQTQASTFEEAKRLVDLVHQSLPVKK